MEAQEIKKAAAAPKDALGDREPIWDNLKGICVLLVVLIHTLRVFEQEVVAEGHFASGLILPLLFVCMPAFCFASGHLSKVADTRGRLVALFRMWAVFLIQQTLYAYFWALQSQYFQATSPVAFPFWKQFLPGVTWFLLCLAVWRTALPLLNLLRWPFLTALVLTMLAQSTDVAQSEYIKPMLSFLPFYLAGYRCPKGFLSAFPRSRDFAKCTFLSILMLSPALSLVLPSLESGVGLFDRMSRPTWTAYGCLYGGRIADSLGQGGPACHSGAGLAVTLAFYAAALPLVFCFLACVPRRQVWGLTRAGAMSVYIYLFHIYFLVFGKSQLLSALEHSGQREHFQTVVLHSVWAVPACIGLAVSLWGCLACGWIRPVCSSLVEPQMEMFLREQQFDVPAKVLSRGGLLRDGLFVVRLRRA